MKTTPIEWTDVFLHAARQQLSYDPTSGRITRIPTGKLMPNTPSGNGYAFCSLTIDRREYATTQHRMGWFLHYGCVPTAIDHINGVRTDNRLCNMRASNATLNQLNRHVKVGRDQHLPIGVYETRRKGRPGIWYSCKVERGGKIWSTYKRELGDAVEYVRTRRAAFVSQS